MEIHLVQVIDKFNLFKFWLNIPFIEREWSEIPQGIPSLNFKQNKFKKVRILKGLKINNSIIDSNKGS